ncbi:MAG: alpha-N-acetylglucosaminidase C-terminal domain-containing protein [Armatimonadota bacterium]|nr:alpha-N-acetylglucosaminidase C-terminal domain-containing protein [Armatimonadota bacterium]
MLRSVFLLFVLAWSACWAGQAEEAQGVLKRLIGARARDFVLKVSPGEDNDYFEYEATGGIVYVSGSTGVSVCRGAYEYLKAHCGVLVTWDGDQLSLPRRFPNAEKRQVVSPNRFRHYYNVCTFGYTSPFWDWKRWRREVDWMALHGINNPLAMNGQERIWQSVWRSYGLSDDVIRGYFTGPAFLPWHRMGNVNSHAGPIPQSYLDHDLALQKKILAAERALGMMPVTPGFAGFVPPELKSKKPNARFTNSSGWCGFEPTTMLDARDPLFAEIQQRFLNEYTKEFGESHYYLADLYNEMHPQVSETSKLDDLRETGAAIYRSMKKADPEAKWVMQGWLFFNEPTFWGQPEVEAFLRDVPDEGMLLIDLIAENSEVWRRHSAFRRKPYIWATLHGFGGRTRLFGNIDVIASKPIVALGDAQRGSMVGMGITMEGIDQNALVYEMALDNMWRNKPIDVDEWIVDYAERRYGTKNFAARRIYRQMRDVFYKGDRVWQLHPYQLRPGSGQILEPAPDDPAPRALLSYMLSSPFDTPLFRRDVVDVAKECAGVATQAALFNIAAAMQRRGEAATEILQFQDLLMALDSVLDEVPQYRLTNWIKQARSITPDKTLLERNARTQVTIWGGPVLNEYAAKEWSGLVSDFYLQRWLRYFDSFLKHDFNEQKFADEIIEWEKEWTSRLNLKGAAAGVSFLTRVKALTDAINAIPVSAVDRGIAYGKPATDSGGTEGSHLPGLVTDGDLRGNFWAAGPAPQWVRIDLAGVETISRIQVFPYADDNRSYAYTVEISVDGDHWTVVADRPKGTPATGMGDSIRFTPLAARYVRVVMTHNSANPSVHLREVRVFR